MSTWLYWPCVNYGTYFYPQWRYYFWTPLFLFSLQSIRLLAGVWQVCILAGRHGTLWIQIHSGRQGGHTAVYTQQVTLTLTMAGTRYYGMVYNMANPGMLLHGLVLHYGNTCLSFLTTLNGHSWKPQGNFGSSATCARVSLKWKGISYYNKEVLHSSWHAYLFCSSLFSFFFCVTKFA